MQEKKVAIPGFRLKTCKYTVSVVSHPGISERFLLVEEIVLAKKALHHALPFKQVWVCCVHGILL